MLGETRGQWQWPRPSSCPGSSLSPPPSCSFCITGGAETPPSRRPPRAVTQARRETAERASAHSHRAAIVRDGDTRTGLGLWLPEHPGPRGFVCLGQMSERGDAEELQPGI